MSIRLANSRLAEINGSHSGDQQLQTSLESKRATSSRPSPRIKDITELVADFPDLRQPLIEGLLRKGETANIVADPKAGKSWLVLGLSMCVATGQPWLGYTTQKAKVLVIDNELHSSTLSSRVKTVAQKMNIPLDELSGQLMFDSLRGRLTNIVEMVHYFDQLDRGQFDLIVLDALYRFLGPNMNENSNSDLAQLYNHIDEYADHLDCSFIAVHHATKGDQSGKKVTDMGAGAGSQSRAVDAQLVIRPHEISDMAVLEGAVRSFPPPGPLSIKWEFPLWIAKSNIEPKLQQRQTANRAKSDADDNLCLTRLINEFKDGEEFTQAGARRAIGCGADKASRLLVLAVERNLVVRVESSDARNRNKTNRKVNKYKVMNECGSTDANTDGNTIPF